MLMLGFVEAPVSCASLTSKFLPFSTCSMFLYSLVRITCGDSIEDNFDEDYEEKMVRYFET